MTNEELYKAVENESRISKEVTDILFELDTTASSSTQAELNELLVTLYKRIGQEEIVIEENDDSKPISTEEFTGWVEERFDSYSTDMFEDSI